MRLGKIASLMMLAAAFPAAAQDVGNEPARYMTPPAPIAQILDAPATPLSSVSPTGHTVAHFGFASLPSIAELGEPELKLGAFGINPRNNALPNSRIVWFNAINFHNIMTRSEQKVALPVGTRFTSANWSPDGSRVAFLVDGQNGMQLWVVDSGQTIARRVSTAFVNLAFGVGYEWLPDSSGFIVRMVPSGRGPETKSLPGGPIIQENVGQTAAARSQQGLLRNPSDERLFEYYFTSQLAQISLNGETRPIGAPGIISGLSVSPNGEYILQTRIKRPFSYVAPVALFPTEITVTDLGGVIVHNVADLPLRDAVPPQMNAVAPGVRSVEWRSDKPATLFWVEAQDGGDPVKEAAVRDRLFMLDAPFTGQPRRLLDLKHRYWGISWGRENFALVYSEWWKTRHETRIAVDPSRPGQGRVLLERNSQDRYDDPGDPLMRRNAQGRQVMHFTPDGKAVLVTGTGGSPAGEFPFLARMNVSTGETERLWQAKMPYYETVLAVLDDSASRLLTSRESRIEPPNLYLRVRSGGEPVQITSFADPAPQLAGITQKLLTYKRADGVDLSGTLYLPAGYDRSRDEPLPLLMWAYPADFTNAKIAGQALDTQNRFSRPAGMSHLFLLTQGYAILDNPSIPIIGANGAEGNDTYIEQLVSSAQAAVDAVVKTGVADPAKIAVGGHSYGAFMTANLLAHTDLFRAGLALSGAYNRTLSPFGFQNEQRTYWDAMETYNQMSPFTHVRSIKEPLLLIHGEADSASGTPPIQSERFYSALKGQGANVRYVLLPLEPHTYRSRESILHTLWEVTRWLDKHVKNAPAATTTAAAASK